MGVEGVHGGVALHLVEQDGRQYLRSYGMVPAILREVTMVHPLKSGCVALDTHGVRVQRELAIGLGLVILVHWHYDRFMIGPRTLIRLIYRMIRD